MTWFYLPNASTFHADYRSELHAADSRHRPQWRHTGVSSIRHLQGGKTYNLHMARTNANFPETDSANVTCIFPTSGTAPCSQWRLWPTGTYLAADGTTRQANVANLSIYSIVKGKVTHVKQGNFYVSFSILIMKP